MPYTEYDYWKMRGGQYFDAVNKLDCAMWLLKKAIEETWPDKEQDSEEMPPSSKG